MIDTGGIEFVDSDNHIFTSMRYQAELAIREADVISFCREHLAGFKVPRTVVFTQLPKTSTGKIQKFMLRDMAKKL